MIAPRIISRCRNGYFKRTLGPKGLTLSGDFGQSCSILACIDDQRACLGRFREVLRASRDGRVSRIFRTPDWRARGDGGTRPLISTDVINWASRINKRVQGLWIAQQFFRSGVPNLKEG